MKLPVIAFRAVTPVDESFLFKVYADSRQEELAGFSMADNWKQVFLQQQFRAQMSDWNLRFPAARREIILIDREPAGRLYVRHDAEARRLHVVEIALLTQFRGRGFGTRIFHRLFAEAEACAWQVSLQVDPASRAFRFYCSLGFTPAAQAGPRLIMQRALPMGTGVGTVGEIFFETATSNTA